MPALVGLALYHALSGRDLIAGRATILLPSALVTLAICLIVFGPMLALMLCVTQRARAEQVYGADFYLGYSIKRLNTIALYCAGLALAFVTLTIFSGLVLRAGT
jgi:F0F1-type ATP synthase assembly protein I